MIARGTTYDETLGGGVSRRPSIRFRRALQGSPITFWPSSSSMSNAAKAMGAARPMARLEDGLDAFAAVAGHGLAVQHGRCDGPADVP